MSHGAEEKAAGAARQRKEEKMAGGDGVAKFGVEVKNAEKDWIEAARAHRKVKDPSDANKVQKPPDRRVRWKH